MKVCNIGTVDDEALMMPPATPLTDAEREEKEELITQGFEDWSRRDFQQFVRALESYGWFVVYLRTFASVLIRFSRTDDYELLASEIQDKNADDVAEYYPAFKKKWKELSGECFLLTCNIITHISPRVPTHSSPHSRG